MKTRTNRTQSWLVLAALGGVLAAYAYFFYLPASREMASLSGQLAEAEQQAAGTFSIVTAIGAAQAQLDASADYTRAWLEAAPSEHELSEVFERIHKLTRLAQTETTRFEPQSVVAYETFLRIPVSMECEGTFPQLAAVLTGLENMQEPVWLQSVEIQSTGQDSELARAQINLDVFADNLEDSDQENLSGKPITQEADPISRRL